jgi:ferrous iron transport protein A
MATAASSFFTLSTMPTGVSGLVSHFGDQHLAGRLMAMGVLPGSRVEVLRSAPFGGGFYVKADNLLLALRSEEAQSIFIRQ